MDVRISSRADGPAQTEGLQQRLDQIAESIRDVDNRAANVRAGYVYVISNIGSFGEDTPGRIVIQIRAAEAVRHLGAKLGANGLR
jgi:hypothetical protein